MKIVQLENLGASKEQLENLKKEFEQNGHEFTYYTERKEDEKTLIERSKDADIILVSNIILSENFIKSCPNLKLISVAFTGIDHIAIDICNERKITVCNAAGFSTISVAEMTLGMIISLYRKIVWADKQTRNLGGRDGFLGTELFGKKVGIIGTGDIGLYTAKLLQAFGCEIVAYSRTKKEIPNIKYISLDELLKTSDIVSLHIPYTKETHELINETAISKMKSSAVLINTARGKVINSQALANALKEEKIAGAATDIYEIEPPLPENHPLFSAPNLLMLPHIAYASNESFEKRINIVVQNIYKWLKNEPQNVMK